MWGATGRINSLGPAVTLAGAPGESLYTQGNPPAPLSFRMSRAPRQVKGLHPPSCPCHGPRNYGLMHGPHVEGSAPTRPTPGICLPHEVFLELNPASLSSDIRPAQTNAEDSWPSAPGNTPTQAAYPLPTLHDQL